MKKKFIIFIIISLPILLLIFARHNHIDLGNNDPGNVSSVDRIVNEFDFIRIIKKKIYPLMIMSIYYYQLMILNIYQTV